MLCYLVVRDVLAVVGCARESSGHGQVVWEQYTYMLRRVRSPGLELASVEKVQHCRENTLSDDMNLGERGRSSVLGRDRGRAVAVANGHGREFVGVRSPEPGVRLPVSDNPHASGLYLAPTTSTTICYGARACFPR